MIPLATLVQHLPNARSAAGGAKPSAARRQSLERNALRESLAAVILIDRRIISKFTLH
jgi:hypothetical protein